MKINTKGRYAVRCVLNLAMRKRSASTPISVIAREENISSQYIEQLFLSLKKAGILQSIRGREGGYILKKDPSEVSLADIIRAVEGPICVSECVKNGECERLTDCPTAEVWSGLSENINSYLESITLEALRLEAAGRRKKRLLHSHEFSI